MSTMKTQKIRLVEEGFISLDNPKTVMTYDGKEFFVKVKRSLPKAWGDDFDDYIEEMRSYKEGLIEAKLTLHEAINEDDTCEFALEGYRPATERELETIRKEFKL